jgi:septum formation protein
MNTHRTMLVLASASPRRQELLRNAGILFEIQPSDISEEPLPDEKPQALVQRLAREKALAVSLRRPNDPILGADTTVVIEDQILGKPRDGADASRMLRLLSGRTHQVITGVCVIAPLSGIQRPVSSEQVLVRSEQTLVTMLEITDREIADYVATGEPMDKAGAYAIQGIASRWIPRIEGDYSNVVGLPVALVVRMLKESSQFSVNQEQ